MSRQTERTTLTDCVSFVLMHEHGIAGALTADRHCIPAGFRAFLRDRPRA